MDDYTRDMILDRLRKAEDRLCDLYARVDTGLDRVAAQHDEITAHQVAQIEELRQWITRYHVEAHTQVEPPPKRPWYTRGAWPYIVGGAIGLALLAYLQYMYMYMGA